MEVKMKSRGREVLQERWFFDWIRSLVPEQRRRTRKVNPLFFIESKKQSANRKAASEAKYWWVFDRSVTLTNGEVFWSVASSTPDLRITSNGTHADCAAVLAYPLPVEETIHIWLTDSFLRGFQFAIHLHLSRGPQQPSQSPEPAKPRLKFDDKI